MPLRTAPLPRMAGDLTFMRSRRATLDSLNAESLAVLGAPFEDNVGRKSGTRFAPTALRETSVYFGWHANPQFAHPVDINERVPIDTSEMHPEGPLRKAGALYESKKAFFDTFANHVVVDGNLVTGQNQNSGAETAYRMLELLAE